MEVAYRYWSCNSYWFYRRKQLDSRDLLQGFLSFSFFFLCQICFFLVFLPLSYLFLSCFFFLCHSFYTVRFLSFFYIPWQEIWQNLTCKGHTSPVHQFPSIWGYLSLTLMTWPEVNGCDRWYCMFSFIKSIQPHFHSHLICVIGAGTSSNMENAWYNLSCYKLHAIFGFEHTHTNTHTHTHTHTHKKKKRRKEKRAVCWQLFETYGITSYGSGSGKDAI